MSMNNDMNDRCSFWSVVIKVVSPLNRSIGLSKVIRPSNSPTTMQLNTDLKKYVQLFNWDD